jgi:hypothetical protein
MVGKHEMSPGFLIALLTILRADSNKTVRQAAAIYFKNRVQQGWEASKKAAIHDHDKEVVRQNLLGVLLEVNEVVSIRYDCFVFIGIMSRNEEVFGVRNDDNIPSLEVRNQKIVGCCELK